MNENKIICYFDACVKNWEDEDYEGDEDLHLNDDLETWRYTFEDQFFPASERPEGRLTDEEVTELVRRLRVRFPMRSANDMEIE